MKYTSRMLSIGLFCVGIIVVIFVMSHLQNASLSRRLAQSQQEIEDLQGRLAATARQQCAQNYTWQSGSEYPVTIESSGGTRTYTVHTPQGYTPNQRYPVIIAFDGLNGTSQRAEEESGLNSLPVLVVYPDALLGKTGATAWQGAPYSPTDVNDVQFMSDMLAKLTKDYCIDTNAVFMVGMSNGAGFAFLAACELRDKITGVAGISGAYYTQCRHQRAQHYALLIHSPNDMIIPFEGSRRRSLPDIYKFAQRLGKSAQCQQMLASEGEFLQRFDWAECAQDRHISLIVTHLQPHGWLNVDDDELVPEGQISRRSTSAVIWDFFTRR